MMDRMNKERGLAPSIEAAILLPALVLVIGLIVAWAHVALAKQEVQSMASAAARAASLARTVPDANRAVSDVLHGSVCGTPHVSLDATALTRPAGTSGNVRVTLRCDVDLSAVGLSGFPGSVEVSASAQSPVDRYRSR